jgi:hypothetical protein
MNFNPIQQLKIKNTYIIHSKMSKVTINVVRDPKIMEKFAKNTNPYITTPVGEANRRSTINEGDFLWTTTDAQAPAKEKNCVPVVAALNQAGNNGLEPLRDTVRFAGVAQSGSHHEGPATMISSILGGLAEATFIPSHALAFGDPLEFDFDRSGLMGQPPQDQRKMDSGRAVPRVRKAGINSGTALARSFFPITGNPVGLSNFDREYRDYLVSIGIDTEAKCVKLFHWQHSRAFLKERSRFGMAVGVSTAGIQKKHKIWLK